jgi:alkanesulfonate monooxygenase SsuD/methylene tetrahydromethanopterin reductase-like flavin-dependent oxidoreductase (luciferase family)
MQVFIFDLMHYKADIRRFEVDGQLPRLLGRSTFDPKAAVETYAEHLDAWEEMERVGFDGVGVNEHHATPFGLMNSPNLLVASAAQRTKRMKLLIYGNLLPLHEPLRLAEELAMLDCLSGGRLIAGVARGAPREYRAHNIPMSESRARFEEGFEILRRAWTEEAFSFHGQFHRYEDVALWPRPVQQPHPPVWVPVTGSKETIEWAAANNLPITPGVARSTAREDTIRLYAQLQAGHGRRVTPGHFNVMIDCYVADSKEKAVEEYGPHYTYAFNTLIRYDHPTQDFGKTGYYGDKSQEHLRAGVKGTLADVSMFDRRMTMESFRAQAEHMAIGSPDEVAERIVAEAEDAGAETVLLMCNRGAMPKEMFLNQIRRLGAEVLPRLQARRITRVPHAEGVSA